VNPDLLELLQFMSDTFAGGFELISRFDLLSKNETVSQRVRRLLTDHALENHAQ
jgi:hypothetical protein